MNWYIILIDRCTRRGWATMLPNQISFDIASWKRRGLFRVSYRNYFSNKSIYAWCIESIPPITICSNIMEAHLLQIQTPRFLMRSQQRGTLLLCGSSRNWAMISRQQLLTAWVIFTVWLLGDSEIGEWLDLSQKLGLLRIQYRSRRESIIKNRFCGGKSWHSRLRIAFAALWPQRWLFWQMAKVLAHHPRAQH